MSQNTKKIGFWSVFALVTGSQIGSGVFMLPTKLAPYGLYALGGWVIAGCGAIALSLVFAKLCSLVPKTGGPHAYIQEAFGNTPAFFTGWTYWVISWVSTTAVVTAIVSNLTPLIGQHSPMTYLVLQIAILVCVTGLNFRGVSAAGSVEFFLTVIKIIPLMIIPFAALFYFKSSNFMLDASVASLGTSGLLSGVTISAFWGFVGLESGTTPAGSVENPTKTIPQAIVAGTASVALLYMINSLGIMGIVPGSQLMTSVAPYADAVKALIGGSWYVVITSIAAIICVGTLNAWMLTSGQIALGLAQDGFMPAWFGKKNSFDAPYVGLLLSFIGIVPLLCLTAGGGLAAQIAIIIDISVTAFLFVYAICCLAFFKILWERSTFKNNLLALVYGLLALLFCGWFIAAQPVETLLYASLFTLSGLPVYWYMQR
jgi:APA family basic amino acid/polyamine antiporter